LIGVGSLREHCGHEGTVELGEREVKGRLVQAGEGFGIGTRFQKPEGSPAVAGAEGGAQQGIVVKAPEGVRVGSIGEEKGDEVVVTVRDGGVEKVARNSCSVGNKERGELVVAGLEGEFERCFAAGARAIGVRTQAEELAQAGGIPPHDCKVKGLGTARIAVIERDPAPV
jgi:hypothetical protein